jgi:hypothetical protein
MEPALGGRPGAPGSPEACLSIEDRGLLVSVCLRRCWPEMVGVLPPLSRLELRLGMRDVLE